MRFADNLTVACLEMRFALSLVSDLLFCCCKLCVKLIVLPKLNYFLFKNAFSIKPWLGITFFFSKLCVLQTIFCLKLPFAKILFLVFNYDLHRF